MPGVELASAYISLIPSAKGIGKKIATEIDAPVVAASRDAGEKAAGGFAESFRNKTSSLGSTFAKVGAAATVGLTVPILAAGKQLVDAASNAAESLSKAKVVFGNEVGIIEQLAADSAKKLGISAQEVLAATGTFGNLFVSLKIGQRPAAEMSSRLVTLAADLASFNNVSPEDALEALRAGIVGETEPLRRFGVNLNDATLKAKAMELGLSDGKATLTASAKAQAAYAVILEQTSVAQGDFARTADGAANKQRIITAQFQNAKATLGQALLPIFLQVAQAVSGLAEKFGNLSPTVQKVVLAVAGVLAIAGPLGMAIGGLVTVIGLIASPVGLVIAGIVALGAALVYAYTRVESFRALVNGVAQVVGGFVVPRIRLLVELFQTKIVPAMREAARIIAEALKPKIDELRAAFEKNRPEIEKVVEVVGRLVDWFARAWVQMAEFLLPILARVAGFFGGVFIDNIRIVIEGVSTLVRFMERLSNIKPPGWFEKLPGDGGWIGKAIGARAAGGMVRAGSPYLVGERGPELMIPGASGYVVPNHALTGGGGTVQVNLIAPHNASVAAQAAYAGQAVSWLIGRNGRR